MITKLLEANARNTELANDPASPVNKFWFKSPAAWVALSVKLAGWLILEGYIPADSALGKGLGAVFIIAGALGFGVQETMRTMSATKNAAVVTAEKLRADAIQKAIEAKLPLP